MAITTATGRIAQVIGSTFDVDFDEGHLPDIYTALKIETEDKGVKIDMTGEVQQQLGGNRVRCVALGSTDGLVRGVPVLDTGGPGARRSRGTRRRHPSPPPRAPAPRRRGGGPGSRLPSAGRSTATPRRSR